MSTSFCFRLLKANMGAPVRHNVRLDGGEASQPGITAVGVRAGSGGWCVFADDPRNSGVSVTNGAESYAVAVCDALGCAVGALDWYAVDSDGLVDVVEMSGESAGFAPLFEDGCIARSAGALEQRLAKLHGGLPAEARTLLEACHARFAPARTGHR